MDTDGLQFANPIDNLTYLYDTDNKNLLLKVTDATNNPQGFKDGTNTDNDYSYDDNGNLTKDKNKNITAIKYNHLNLPTQIIFVNGNKILYLYNATGQKLNKVVTSSETNTTDYLAGFQYKNTELQFFPHAEGYVNATRMRGGYRYNYVFNYTDHLGNIRLSFGVDQGNVLKIIEENHYYPFGLKHSGYNSDQMMYIKEDISFIKIKPRPALLKTDYNYKYNGKEYQDELGLNMYDYGARNYDPAISRWVNVDPLAEKFPNFNPYNYVMQNPLNLIDPTGMAPEEGGGDEQPKINHYTVNTKGEINLVNSVNGEGPDVLHTQKNWNKGVKDKGISVKDKEILKNLKTLKEDKPGKQGSRLMRSSVATATDKSIDDYAKVFYFVAMNSEVEWNLGYVTKGDKNLIGLGTFENTNLSPGMSGLFGNDIKVISGTHSHPMPSLSEEKGSMYGDIRQAAELKKNYKNYVLMNGSGNLWQITPTNNGYSAESKLVKKTTSYKDIKVK